MDLTAIHLTASCIQHITPKISCSGDSCNKHYKLAPYTTAVDSSFATLRIGFPIPGPFSNTGILGLESANPGILGLIPRLGVSKKTANLLAHKFLQAVFLSVKWSLPLWSALVRLLNRSSLVASLDSPYVKENYLCLYSYMFVLLLVWLLGGPLCPALCYANSVCLYVFLPRCQLPL